MSNVDQALDTLKTKKAKTKAATEMVQVATKVAAAKTAKAKAPKKAKADDGLTLPANLKVENRTKPEDRTAEEQGRIDAATAKAAEAAAQERRKQVAPTKTSTKKAKAEKAAPAPKTELPKAKTLPEKAKQPKGAFNAEVIDRLTGMLQRKNGMTIAEAVKACGWEDCADPYLRVKRYIRDVAEALQKFKVAMDDEAEDRMQTRFSIRG